MTPVALADGRERALPADGVVYGPATPLALWRAGGCRTNRRLVVEADGEEQHAGVAVRPPLPKARPQGRLIVTGWPPGPYRWPGNAPVAWSKALIRRSPNSPAGRSQRNAPNPAGSGARPRRCQAGHRRPHHPPARWHTTMAEAKAWATGDPDTGQAWAGDRFPPPAPIRQTPGCSSRPTSTTRDRDHPRGSYHRG